MERGKRRRLRKEATDITLTASSLRSLPSSVKVVCPKKGNGQTWSSELTNKHQGDETFDWSSGSSNGSKKVMPTRKYASVFSKKFQEIKLSLAWMSCGISSIPRLKYPKFPLVANLPTFRTRGPARGLKHITFCFNSVNRLKVIKENVFVKLQFYHLVSQKRNTFGPVLYKTQFCSF